MALTFVIVKGKSRQHVKNLSFMQNKQNIKEKSEHYFW